jgi:quinol monooxygenase YgiN
MDKQSIHSMTSLNIKEEYLADAIPVITNFVQQTQKESGCIYMNFFQSMDTASNVVFVSKFRSEDDYKVHDTSPWHQSIIEYLSDKLAGLPERTNLTKIC